LDEQVLEMLCLGFETGRIPRDKVQMVEIQPFVVSNWFHRDGPQQSPKLFETPPINVRIVDRGKAVTRCVVVKNILGPQKGAVGHGYVPVDVFAIRRQIERSELEPDETARLDDSKHLRKDAVRVTKVFESIIRKSDIEIIRRKFKCLSVHAP
jgi:hypothetical protein